MSDRQTIKDIARRFARMEQPYVIMLIFFAAFVVFAFIVDSPDEIYRGFLDILVARAALAADYIYIGGIGAAIINAVFVSVAAIAMLVFLGVKPNGAAIMAVWITFGFAFFGKNLLNMLPLMFGIWLYSRYKKEPFSNFYLASLLIAAISPTVGEIAFLGLFSRPVEIIIGIFIGLLIGFIFPPIAAYTARVQNGFNLYNMGFAGGLVCTVIVAWLVRHDIEFIAESAVSSGNNLLLGIFLYITSIALICCGLFIGNIKENLKNYKEIHKSSGRLVSDFFVDHGNSVYINAGVLCAFSTTLVLVLGADLTGPTMAGIFTVMSFGSFGKHMRNVWPIMAGAIISVFVNQGDPGISRYIIPILFSTGLAPFAGQFGWKWGIVAGFIHVNIATHTGYLAGGLNLYANGYAAGFVVIFLLPIIMAFGKDKGKVI